MFVYLDNYHNSEVSSNDNGALRQLVSTASNTGIRPGGQSLGGLDVVALLVVVKPCRRFATDGVHLYPDLPLLQPDFIRVIHSPVFVPVH